MKFLVNICSVVIMLLSFSSITSAQEQKRPSQRSFAEVLQRIKEKRSGRERVQQNQQPEDSISGGKDPAPDQQLNRRSNTKVDPSLWPGGSPDPSKLPSRQPLKVPARPKSS